MLSKIMSLTREKDYFSVEKEKDFYYQVSFKNTELAFTKTKDQADSLVAQIKKMIDWKPYRNIGDLFDKDREKYDDVAKVITKYAVPVKKNGNYRNEWKETGKLSYRLDYKGLVEAQEELSPGVSLRKKGNDFAVDLILAGKTYIEFDTADQAKKFIRKTQAWMPWHEEEVIKIIERDVEVSAFLKKLEWEIVNGEELSKPSAEVISNFLFKNFGENSEEKKAVYKETIQELGEMVGLKPIKDYVQNLFKMIAAEEKLRALGIGESSPEMHALFVGPPGTGKTVVARMYADLLWSLNKIPEKKLIEVSKEDLVSAYVGDTEIKTKEVIEKAMGGVLFVDEAYMLVNEGTNKGNDYGKIALEILMRAAENNRGKIVIVFGGYERAIDKLMDANEGLRSRFSKKFHFEDYSPKELTQIANGMIKSQGFDAVNVQDELLRVIETKYKRKEMNGNARDVRKMVGTIIDNHKLRIIDQGDYWKIDPEDVMMVTRREDTRSSETLKDMQEKANKKLEELIGLKGLKREIRTWANVVKAEKARERLNMDSTKVALHMAFKGSPGTGKTTVARIVAEILKSNGLLTRGHFKEIKRSDLVAGYQGQTSEKVAKLMKEMDGGVILLDEAYSLVQSKDDQFGREALDTLIAEIENRRDNLVLIIAGYEKEIDELLEENPGFKSRIPNHFVFTDYDGEELVQLMKLKLNEQGFKMEGLGMERLEKIIAENWKSGVTSGDRGNGRWVRNMLEKMKKNQADRLSIEDDYTQESLSTLKEKDIPEIL